MEQETVQSEWNRGNPSSLDGGFLFILSWFSVSCGFKMDLSVEGDMWCLAKLSKTLK